MPTDRIIQTIGHLSELAETLRQFDDGLQAHTAGHLSESDLGQMFDTLSEREDMLEASYARVTEQIFQRRRSWHALGKRATDHPDFDPATVNTPRCVHCGGSGIRCCEFAAAR